MKKLLVAVAVTMLVGCAPVSVQPITQANYVGGQYTEDGLHPSGVYPVNLNYGSTGGDGAAK